MILHIDGTGQVSKEGQLVPVPTVDGTALINSLPVPLSSKELELVSSAIRQVDLRAVAPASRARFALEATYDEVIGSTIVVRTTPGERILWARRPRRLKLSRLVAGREPEPSKYFTVVIEQHGDEYHLTSAYIGRPLEAEPDDYYRLIEQVRRRDVRRRIYKRSRAFWSCHAFVQGFTALWPQSITDVCPDGWANAPIIHPDRGKNGSVKTHERRPKLRAV